MADTATGLCAGTPKPKPSYFQLTSAIFTITQQLNCFLNTFCVGDSYGRLSTLQWQHGVSFASAHFPATST